VENGTCERVEAGYVAIEQVFGRRPAGEKAARRRTHRIWVGGYTRQDGTKVDGYYRDNPNAR
jgi:hypothetical protein